MSRPSAALQSVATGYGCRSNFKSEEQAKFLLANDIKNRAFALPRQLMRKRRKLTQSAIETADTPLACKAIHGAQRSLTDRRCPVHCQKCSKQSVPNSVFFVYPYLGASSLLPTRRPLFAPAPPRSIAAATLAITEEIPREQGSNLPIDRGINVHASDPEAADQYKYAGEKHCSRHRPLTQTAIERVEGL